jgi:flavin reductase (DIM6/NTAB) family NADH-FMN oxidoreductase RutF
MATFTIADFEQWNRIYRANFINSLSGYKPAFLIGTVNDQGNPNLAIFSNIIHFGADPAMIGFLNRPREAAPHTIANIEVTRSFTLNQVTASMVDQAHQTSAKYPEGVSEFEATGLTPKWKDDFIAPFVKESEVRIGMELSEIIPIKTNGTFLIIGKVKNVEVSEKIIREDGFLDLESLYTVCTQGIDGYFIPKSLKRLKYAKP